ncbi:MAG: DUF4476 domain-containing protein [Bacteroidetes bacterium]|nr:DUF4476 domain-containing protein [Bacteroidota bacterium]
MRAAFFIFLLLPALTMLSQNNLRLYSGGGVLFTAWADDTIINKKPEVDVLLEKITDDSINVKVELANKSSAKTTVFLLEKGKPVKNKEFKYLIEVRNNKIKISYSGVEDIRPLPSPLVPLKPIVDTSYKLRNNLLGNYCELKEGKALYFNNLPKKGECVTAMPSVYLAYMNSLMKRAEVEDDKFSIAENTCMNNCMSVSQLNNILTHIAFELEKLKLIRLAYFHITDKANQNKLDSTFKLESSKRELAFFLKNSADYKVKTGYSCTTPAGENEISELCQKLSIYSNDAERFQFFKKAYSALCYTSLQSKAILATYIHDREKLDAAKLLYYHCTDKENFLGISDIFSYNTTAAELTDFVGKQK